MRTDVPLTDIITWTVEQLYLAMQHSDRSEDTVRRRVRAFLVPALSAVRRPGDALQAHADEVAAALTSAQKALNVLRGGAI